MVHIVVFAVIAYFLAFTEAGKKVREYMIGAVRDKKPTPVKAQNVPQARQGPRPTAKSAPPPPGGGRRQTDAPPPAEGGMIVDERSQTKTRSEAGSGPKTNLVQRVVAPPPPPPPRLFASAPPPSTIRALLVERAKAAASIEAIGSEQISRAGASDAGAVVNKIAGASIVDGKFAVIRGLNDRYISTTFNGANLPSADPYRASAPLDLFPAQVIDRIVVAKTYTPDQPGTATGGSIDVFTKSFPERDFISVSIGGEYNTQASLNNRYLTYNGGGLDWAGMDDGTRALPPAINKLAPIGQVLPDAATSSGAFNTELFTNKVKEVALLDKVTRKLGVVEFGPQRETAPLNHSFSTAIGGSTLLLGRPLGYFVSTSYKHDFGFYENGISSRYEEGRKLKNTYRDSRALDVVNWSGMVNLASKPLDDHELGFTFFYNQNGTDDTRIQDRGHEENLDVTAEYRKFNLYYTERNLNTYQMKGEHRFPSLADLQFNWLVALTETTQDEPDARFFNDVFDGSEFSTIPSNLPAPNKPTRYFRTLEEQNRNIRLDWQLPVRSWTEDDGRFKFGLFDSHSERDFTERQFYYPTGKNGYHSDPSQFLQPGNLGLLEFHTNFVRGVPRSLGYTWGDYVQVFDSFYDGTRDLQAGYLMVDFPVLPRLRLVGGARYETTDIFVHSVSYLASSVTGLRTNDTNLKQNDLLPAAGLIVGLTSNMNLRVNYSQTLARPSFRELAAYYSYDPIISDFVEGNPLLKMTAVDNYDVRYEWFPNPGELISVSAFYKNLKDAIERGNRKLEGDVITYENVDAILYGVEFEARKNLGFLGPEFMNFSLGGNLSLVWSEVKLNDKDLFNKRMFFPNASDTRPLYDQSPYIMNFDLNYTSLGLGTSASLIFNYAGPRIAITKISTDDVYDQPAPVLDFILSQKLGRHTTIKFGAKNLLDPRIERTYGKSGNRLYSSYTKGRAFGVSLTYDF